MKLDFFMQQPIIQDLSMFNLKKLVQAFNLFSYKLNYTVFSQYDPANFVYIVYKGIFELTRRKVKKI